MTIYFGDKKVANVVNEETLTSQCVHKTMDENIYGRKNFMDDTGVNYSDTVKSYFRFIYAEGYKNV